MEPGEGPAVSNRILDVRLEDHSLDPVSAEVWVTVTPERLTPTTEVRGRLVGPSCPYVSTVEVAYPLLPLRRPESGFPGSLRVRVVIPEPSFWDTQSPFLYAGPVELWQDGQRCDYVNVRHGLRRLSLGAGGARINGRPLLLRGRTWEGGFPEQMRTWHEQGYNVLLLPPNTEEDALWYAADQFGLLVLGRLEGDEPETVRHLHALSRHPCCFGWVAGQGGLSDERLTRLRDALGGSGGPFVGAEVGGRLPDAAQFLLAREEDLPTLREDGRPVLLLGGAGATPPALLGRIEE